MQREGGELRTVNSVGKSVEKLLITEEKRYYI